MSLKRRDRKSEIKSIQLVMPAINPSTSIFTLYDEHKLNLVNVYLLNFAHLALIVVEQAILLLQMTPAACDLRMIFLIETPLNQVYSRSGTFTVMMTAMKEIVKAIEPADEPLRQQILRLDKSRGGLAIWMFEAALK